MTRPDRNPLLLLVALLGTGLVAAAYAIWTLEAEVRDGASLLRQQQQTANALLDHDAENTQALSDQRRLVAALQAQVMKLGGTPLLLAPSPAATPRAADPTVAPTPAATRSPASSSPRTTAAPTPRPTGSPSQSPTPQPSSSPLCRVTVGPICVQRSS